jgi:hypothetical protein
MYTYHGYILYNVETIFPKSLHRQHSLFQLCVRREIFLFSPTRHNMCIMYTTTATCFGLFYTQSSVNILHKTHVRVPQYIICKLTNLHEQYHNGMNFPKIITASKVQIIKYRSLKHNILNVTLIYIAINNV